MRIFRFVSIIGALVLSVPALGSEEIPLVNWQAPPYWAPGTGAAARETGKQSPEGRLAVSGSVFLPPSTSALAFTGITPCRLADTRTGSGFPSGYGPPSLLSGSQRAFSITGGGCGIPAYAQAVSFNFTVWAPTTRGDIRVFASGGATPTVSTLNWEANILALANSAVVTLGTGGAVTVQVDGLGTIDLIIDVNGYYAPPQGTSSHLLAVGVVNSGGTVGTGFTNLGTWTPAKTGTGAYQISFLGLRPGCTASFPTILANAAGSGFAYFSLAATNCVSGDTTVVINTASPTNVAADLPFFFLVYGGSPVAGAFAVSNRGWTPSTCTITASTGVEVCE